MAEVLEKRGVYQQALEYVKESLAAKPDEPMSLDTEASILEDLDRYSECISAEQATIRLSDGKYSWMHFTLGNCYFDMQDWSQAATNFRLAAEADKSDAPSAYNLALSLSRQGYSTDADQWFREALNRHPDNTLRSKIVAALR
jgi:tetratricopeptide (TPR) repeat protein